MHALLLTLALTGHANLRPADSIVLAAPVPQEISGTVSDSAGTPVADARLTLVELQRTTTPGATGRFSFTDVASGIYHLSDSAIGFAPVVERVTIAGSGVDVKIALKTSVVELEALQVAASPNATTLLNSPQPVSALSGELLHQAQAPSLGETIQSLPRVSPTAAQPCRTRRGLGGSAGTRRCGHHFRAGD
jgi:hypothetical protein